MCIICNIGDDGHKFLSSWYNAIFELKECEKILLKHSKEFKHYGVIHKKLVRLRREICSLEQERELNK